MANSGTQVLKVNSTYPLGRKDKPLVVSSKKISHDHCEFSVGGFTQGDATNPSSRPSLLVLNKKDKVMKLSRGEGEISINPSTSLELRDKDVLAVVTGIHVAVQWLPICCYLPPNSNSQAQLDMCAGLGIHLVSQPDQSVTHHLTPSLSSNPLIITSLASACTFVKPEWLQELLRLGTSDTGPSELEATFTLPFTNKFKPTFSPALASKYKTFKIWDPNEERLNMLHEFKFIILREKSNLAEADVKELIVRAGGSVDFFDVHDGRAKWHRALTRGRAKEGKMLVVLADQASIQAAIDSNSYKDFYAEAESFGCAIQSFASLIESILDVDTSVLVSGPPSGNLGDPPRQSESSTTIDVEHTQRRATRATSRQPSQEPSETPSNEQLGKPRKTLTRRARNLSVEPELATKPQPSAEEILDIAVPAPKKSLKRRANAALNEDSKAPSQLQAPPVDDSEPARKRAKALFDSLGKSGEGTANTQTAASQTQSQSQDLGNAEAPKSTANLDVVMEEEEETQTIRSGSSQNVAKRKASALEGSHEWEAARPAKVMRKDTNADSASITLPDPSGEKHRKPGAAAGNPDTDAAFLRAIASTKRGKRSEDNFDREFNQLKISKPDLEREEPTSEWAILAEFGDDAHVRGNFMVVMEMDISRENRPLQDIQSRWHGKSNFKKFKQKGTGVRTHAIELVLSQSGDPLFSLEPDGSMGVKSQQEIPASRDKAPAVPASKRAARAPKMPLFLDSDAEAEDALSDPEDAGVVAKQAKPNPRSNNRRAMPTLADDGSDDEIVFKAAKAGRRRLR
ncbi:hypothetical protein BDN72DRAFT_643854 [Pluteus cervinus]|uniref:Uncharacterized protein n=1 Tax=Pluteus cervinus TaxID=181527 RepID=A0ACD3AU67_9AGAR|nr:hypothetical protein BDN72DRAFT_643854 [Pluteus cervinus]